MKIIFLILSAVVGILLSAQSSSAAGIRLRRTNSVGVESSDHDDKAPSYAAMNRNSIRSLQGLDKSMSMAMMTAGIESATESGSDDWVLEVINKLESETGVAIIQSVAMNIIKSNELPAHHHHSGQMKCRWFLTLLFKYKQYYFFGSSDDYLNHIIDYVCDEEEEGPKTSNPSATPTSKSEHPSLSLSPSDLPSVHPSLSLSLSPSDLPSVSLSLSPSDLPSVHPSLSLSPTTSCPDGSSTDEGEGCRNSFPDTFNGGCSGRSESTANSGFSNITFGESVCGTVSNYVDVDNGVTRDTDWYYFKVSTDTTVSGRLTTDFPAVLILVRLDGVASCPATTIAVDNEGSFCVVRSIRGDNTYEISTNVTAGDYSIALTSQSLGDPSLFCPTPGNYTLTLTEGPIPGFEVTSASVSTTGNQMFDKSRFN